MNCVLVYLLMAPTAPSGTVGDLSPLGQFSKEQRVALFLWGTLFGRGEFQVGPVAIFIDGGCLDKMLHHDFGGAKMDYARFSQEWALPDEILRAYYYHCLPCQSNPPTEEGKQRYGSRHKFTTALSCISRFEVRLGRLAKTLDIDGNVTFTQKRVDTMIGVDMALPAGKGRVGRVALLSGDGDHTPAVEAVKREGVLVTLWHGSMSPAMRPSRELVQERDESGQITEEIIRKGLH